MIYVILALILAAAVVYALYVHGIIKLPSKTVAPAATNVATPTTPAVVTLPNTNQQVSGVTDAFLRSGAGYGRVDSPTPITGTRDTSPLWTAFDGHANRQTFQPGTPVTFSVNVGKPFTLSVSECPGVNPGGTMTITAVQNGTQVATITKPFAQAVDLPVPVGDAVVTAVYDKVSTFDVTVRQG